MKKSHIISIGLILCFIATIAFFINNKMYSGDLILTGSLKFSSDIKANSAFSEPFQISPSLGKLGLVITVDPSYQSQQTVKKTIYSTLVRDSKFQLESLDGDVVWVVDGWNEKFSRKVGGKWKDQKRVEFLLNEFEIKKPVDVVLKVFPSDKLDHFATDILIAFKIYSNR